MKRFTAIALAALMVLTVFASVIPASAMTVDTVEIRGPVLTGLTNDPANASTNLIDTSNFAGFYYDFKENIGTESMLVRLDSASRAVASGNLTYTTTIMNVNYSSSNLEKDAPVDFQLIGYLAEEYVPIVEDKSDKLSKLLMDDDESHTVRTGQALELGEGYTITAQQVDVDGGKVWLELTKNGDYVADKIIEVASNGATNTWSYDQDIAGENDVVTLKIFIEQVFQGQVDSLAVIDGIWQISDSVMEVKSDDKVGKLEVTTVGSTTITMDNTDNAFTLSQNSDIEITPDLTFKVADSSAIRFYLMKEYTAPGTYEVRGTAMTIVASMAPANVSTWTADNFAGFFYDLKNDKKYETMVLNAGNTTLSDSANRSIAAGALTYTAVIEDVNYSSSNLEKDAPVDFQKIGYLAEEYVPIVTDKSDKLSKLLMDDDESHTVRTGQVLELGEGYAITAQQVDVDGGKVWLELTKNGEYVADKIIEVASNGATNTWSYDQDIAGENDVVTLKIFIEQVFQGQVDSLAVIDGIWQISDSVMEVKSDDKVGKLEVTKVGAATITMQNEDSFTLTRDSDVEIASGIQFKVADDSTLTRIYPFIELTITGEPGEEEPIAPVGTTPANTTPANTTPVDTTPADTTPADTTPADTTPADTTPADTNTTEEPVEEEPGFEAIFAIAGLLAVAFLVRRNK